MGLGVVLFAIFLSSKNKNNAASRMCRNVSNDFCKLLKLPTITVPDNFWNVSACMYVPVLRNF